MSKHVKPMIVVIVTFLFVFAANFVIYTFIRIRSDSASNHLINGLRNVESAKQQWALENKKTTNDTPTWGQLLPYLPSWFTNCYSTNGVVVRPDGGAYIIGRVGESARLSTDGRAVSQ